MPATQETRGDEITQTECKNGQDVASKNGEKVDTNGICQFNSPVKNGGTNGPLKPILLRAASIDQDEDMKKSVIDSLTTTFVPSNNGSQPKVKVGTHGYLAH